MDGKFLFSPVSVNFLTEFMKVVFAIGMLLWQVITFCDLCFVCRLANVVLGIYHKRVSLIFYFLSEYNVMKRA